MSIRTSDWTLTPGRGLSTALCLVPGPHFPTGTFHREWELRERIESGRVAGLRPLARLGVISQAREYPHHLQQHAGAIARTTLLYVEGHSGNDGTITRTIAKKAPWSPDPDLPLNLTPGLLVIGACGYATQQTNIRAIVTPGTLVLASTDTTHSTHVTNIIEPTIEALAAGQQIPQDVADRASAAGWVLFRA